MLTRQVRLTSVLLTRREFASQCSRPPFPSAHIAPAAARPRRAYSSVQELTGSSLVEMFYRSSHVHAALPYLAEPVPDAGFRFRTYAEIAVLVNNLRTAMAPQVRRGDRVAVISNNRIEWAVAAFAVMSLGAQYVPMYEAQLQKDWEHILHDSGASFLFVSKENIYERLKEGMGTTLPPALRRICCFDLPTNHPDSFWSMIKQGSEAPTVQPSFPLPDDIASIIYTSGTTGRPKGTELTHDNFCSNIRGVTAMLPPGVLSPTLRSVAFLPWAHVFGQSAELYTLTAHGASCAIVSDTSKVAAAIKEVRPSVLFVVPMFLKKIYDEAQRKIRQASPVQRWLLNQALRASSARMDMLRRGEGSMPTGLTVRTKLLDAVVLSRVRAGLGGNLSFCVSGGAAAPLPILEFMENIGVPVLEGYGLTETSPVVTANSIDPRVRRLGTVGAPIPGVEVRIVDPDTASEAASATMASVKSTSAAGVSTGVSVGVSANGWGTNGVDNGRAATPGDASSSARVPAVKTLCVGEEGEIVVHGPNVMARYRGMPEENARVFISIDGKRFFRTGDMGVLEPSGVARSSATASPSSSAASSAASSVPAIAVGMPHPAYWSLPSTASPHLPPDVSPEERAEEGGATPVFSALRNLASSTATQPSTTSPSYTLPPLFLRVTGRIKELFKLENGKYVAPAQIETALQHASPLIAHAFVHGHNHTHTVALIAPDMDALRRWCEAEGIITTPGGDVTPATLRDERVVIAFRAAIEECVVRMRRYERPRRWEILYEPFSVSGQTLTAKLSLRRSSIERKYAQLLEALHAGTAGHELSAEAQPAAAEHDD